MLKIINKFSLLLLYILFFINIITFCTIKISENNIKKNYFVKDKESKSLYKKVIKQENYKELLSTINNNKLHNQYLLTLFLTLTKSTPNHIFLNNSNLE